MPMGIQRKSKTVCEIMKTMKLWIKKEECKNRCPIPLNLIPNVEKGINKINYNEKTKIEKIKYNDKLLSKD